MADICDISLPVFNFLFFKYFSENLSLCGMFSLLFFWGYSDIFVLVVVFII